MQLSPPHHRQLCRCHRRRTHSPPLLSRGSTSKIVDADTAFPNLHHAIGTANIPPSFTVDATLWPLPPPSLLSTPPPVVDIIDAYIPYDPHCCRPLTLPRAHHQRRRCLRHICCSVSGFLYLGLQSKFLACNEFYPIYPTYTMHILQFTPRKLAVA